MGQKPSHVGGRLSKTSSLSWFLWSQKTTRNPNPEQPIKFQYKTRRKHSIQQQDKNQNKNNINSNPTQCHSNNKQQTLNNLNKTNQNLSDLSEMKNTNINNAKCKTVKSQNAPVRTKSEPSLFPEKREKRRRKKYPRMKSDWHTDIQQFGYEIYDVDSFLAKASIEKPANIPVVLAFPSVLYQTRTGGYQDEISLPLGMVVNAVFKNQHWLYVQTPHAEEGYVSYAACLPLGIIPPPDDDTPAPCWEKSTDVFPKPSGNMTDIEKMSSKSDCGGDSSRCYSRRSRNAASTCGEKSVDRLYLRATAFAKSRGTRQTLLVITKDYREDKDNNSLCVTKGEVVTLLGTPIAGWFWVRNKEGREGFIPAAIAGHGFL